MTLWSVPFEERYLCSVPQGVINISEAATRLHPPPMPDLIVNLVLSQNDPEYAVLRIPDPYSVIFEVWQRLAINPSLAPPPFSGSFPAPAFILSHHRVNIIEQEPADRHKIEARVQHLCSFNIPQDYEDFSPKFSDLGIRRPPESCVLGTGHIRRSPNPTPDPLCLRTIAPDPHRSRNHGDGVAGGETIPLASNPITATMTLIRACDNRIYPICLASGRAVSWPSVDTASFSLHDYLT